MQNFTYYMMYLDHIHLHYPLLRISYQLVLSTFISFLGDPVSLIRIAYTNMGKELFISSWIHYQNGYTMHNNGIHHILSINAFSLNIMISSYIPFPEVAMVSLSYDLELHCVYVLHFHYSSMYWCVYRLIPCPCYCEYH